MKTEEDEDLYAEYLSLCIDLKKSLGKFLENIEQRKKRSNSPFEKKSIVRCYERVSSLHDVMREEIALVVSSKAKLQTRLKVIEKE